MAKLGALTPEEKAKKDGATFKIDPITPEMHMVGRLNYFCGYEAVKDFYSGVIPSIKAAESLIEATEMVWYEQEYRRALGTYYATKDHNTFNKGMKEFTKRIKIDE